MMIEQDPASAERMTTVEVKLAFMEDLLEQLNQQMFRQQQQIEALARELSALRQQAANAGPSTPGSLRDDIPPHY